MPRYSYPPYDFECLYQHNCPYLDGLSTTWVLGEYRRADETYHEHLRIIDILDGELDKAQKRVRELERENAELMAKIKALHSRQFKANRRAGDAKERKDSQDGLIKLSAKPRKRGAPVGHTGWSRPKPQHVDRNVHVPAPKVCPHCRSGNLVPLKGIKEHLQEDIVLTPRPVVTQYLHEEAYCPTCRISVVQESPGELLHAPIGPVAKSTAVYLRYRIGIPYRKVAEIFKDLFGLSFVPASAVGFDRKATSKGIPLYDDLREKIRASDIVHADETSWRNDGMGHFAWYAGNKDIAFFHIDRHRSAKVATSIFGKDFDGIMVRDRYAAYNGIGRTDYQSCLAHIIRKAKEIAQEHALLPDAEQDKNVESFCTRVVKLFQQACKVGEQLLAGSIPWSNTADIEKRFINDLKNICKRPLSFKAAETLRAYLAGPEQKHLFTFLRCHGVPPTNNHAEQSLRHLVIFRKICFGTRSKSGLKTHSILPSLVQTARRQGVHTREFLQTLFTADTATAQAALYNDSS